MKAIATMLGTDGKPFDVIIINGDICTSKKDFWNDIIDFQKKYCYGFPKIKSITVIN